MRILIATNYDLGFYKFRREVVETLLSAGHIVYICLPNGEYIPRFIEMGCKYISCEFDRHGTNPIFELRQMRFYKRVLKQIRPDIVFTYTIKPNCYCGAACAELHIPYVANITGLGTAIENGGMMQIVSLSLYKYGLRRAQKVFFQNSENRAFMLAKGIVKTAYDVLPGSGVNLDQYKVLEYPDGTTVDFAFIARIMKEKGIDQYLDAATGIHRRHPETRFHVCGFCEQEYEERLNQLDKEGTIIYHKLVDDIITIQQISQCTVHPTYYPEGLSNVLLESCACGRPIITTDRPGCQEVIEDGVNGFVVKERDSHDLIDKIEKFLALPWEKRKQMGLAGRKKVEKEFDRAIVVEKYIKELSNGL